MTANAIPPQRRSRFAPRFSLRMLLIAFTAFAIGFPVWYRWPYEEEIPVSTATGVTQITTWQRQWGGERLKHGPERFVFGSRPVIVNNYQRGELHGPFQECFANGALHVSGEYIAGKRDGTWIEAAFGSRTTARTRWKQGKLDGLSEQFGTIRARAPGEEVRLMFSEGRLVSIDERPVEDRLATLLENGPINDDFSSGVWDRPGESLEADQTVGSLVVMAEAQYDICLRIDYRHVDPSRQMVVGDWRELTPAACISATLASGGLTCDYRYGCLWITTPQGATEWRDPTGVSEIQPSPGSALATAWEEDVVLEVEDQPLSVVANDLASRLGIAIDASRVGEFPKFEDLTVLIDGKGHKFKDLLGLILWEKNCRCELRGQTLVILPSE